jgi:hypothetical protein
MVPTAYRRRHRGQVAASAARPAGGRAVSQGSGILNMLSDVLIPIRIGVVNG